MLYPHEVSLISFMIYIVHSFQHRASSQRYKQSLVSQEVSVSGHPFLPV